MPKGFITFRHGRGVSISDFEGNSRILASETRSTIRLAGVLLWTLMSCCVLAAARPDPDPHKDIIKPRLQAKILSSTTPTPVILLFKNPPALSLSNPAHISSILRPKLDTKIGVLRQSQHIFKIRPFQLQMAVAARIDAEGLETLLSDPDLEGIEADEEWEVHTKEGLALTGGQALQTIGFTGEGAAIAIIDTGIDPYHPSLGGAHIPNSKVVRGLDTADGDDDPQDCSGHGTAVASVAAGVSYQWSPNSYFAGGMAPGAKILAYKAAPDSACTSLQESAVILAIEDALLHAHGKDYELVAINISGGAGRYSGACDDVERAMSATAHLATANGIAVIASSGNSGFTDGIAAPACLRDVISVGSVWDSQAGLSGSLFCLNGDCSENCNDAFKNMTEPTCYANSGPGLDLLAPSEYLLAAQAGGHTTSFGGTSGAAPYVSGAVALLSRAWPSSSPEGVRLRLKASGLLRTDPKNNRSTPMLDALGALSNQTVLNEEGTRTLVQDEDGLFHSEIYVDESGEIGELRVLLELRHPHPASLRISLRAPDGSTLCLEDHPEDLQKDVQAYYPVDRPSLEGLEHFSALERHGTWELLIKDDEWSEHAELLRWAVHFSDPIPLNDNPESLTQLIPIVARGPGVGQSYWTSDILFFNASPYVPLELQLYFIPLAGQERADIFQKTILIPGRNLVKIDDFIQDLFELNTGSGELVLRTSGSPLFNSATITTKGKDGGRYGQYIMPADTEIPKKQYLIHIAGGSQFRTNVGVSEIAGKEAGGSIRLYSANGNTAIGDPIPFNLGAYEVFKLDRILDHYAPGTENAWGLVESEGRVQAYASVVDEGTGDATFVPAQGANPAPSWMIPVIARTSGEAQSQWRSEVRILNSGEKDIDLILEYRPNAPGPVFQQSLFIKGKSLTILRDPVLKLFQKTAGSGSLRILDADQASRPLIISSRIYNQTEHGSFGQAIPVTSNGLQGPSTIIRVEDSPARHSNILLTDNSGQVRRFHLEIRDQHNLPLGSELTVIIQPWSSRQINDFLNLMGLSGSTECRVEITPDDPNGSYMALVSIVDEITGDAISVPAVAEVE